MTIRERLHGHEKPARDVVQGVTGGMYDLLTSHILPNHENLGV